MLTVRDASAAVEFNRQAFGAAKGSLLRAPTDDPDGATSQAVGAGATEVCPVDDQPYGLRQGRVADPFGHHWLIRKPFT